MLRKISSMKKVVIQKVKIKKQEEEEGEEISLKDHEDQQQSTGNNSSSTPTGFVAIYVGEERTRFVVPTSHLSHPLFKMLLEKAEDEFGFEQHEGLVIPCTVPVFQQVVDAIQTSHGQFDFGNMVQHFI